VCVCVYVCVCEQNTFMCLLRQIKPQAIQAPYISLLLITNPN